MPMLGINVGRNAESGIAKSAGTLIIIAKHNMLHRFVRFICMSCIHKLKHRKTIKCQAFLR